MSESGAASAAELMLWVKKEGDAAWAEVIIDSSDSVARLTEAIARKLGLTERLSTLTVHELKDAADTVLGAALDSRTTVATSGLKDRASIVVKVPAPAPIGESCAPVRVLAPPCCAPRWSSLSSPPCLLRCPARLPCCRRWRSCRDWSW
jgi:hypothetical protein